MKSPSRMLLLFGALLVTTAAAPGRIQAQSIFSVWLGVGEASDSGSSEFGTAAKQLSAQVSVPLMPLAVRADALLLGDGVSLDGLSYNLNVVVRMVMPLLQPYAIAGRGTYARDNDSKASGWNAGGGIRFGVARFGVFVEVRRHFPIKRTNTLIGVTL